MIRQAISCDICGNEKKQTNHWFVAYDQGGELRVSGWNSRNRLRPGSKHLCGQTCLHKLVDEFMAKALRARPPQAAADDAAHDAAHDAAGDLPAELLERAARMDASLTSSTVYADEIESSARLIPTPAPVAPARPVATTQPEAAPRPPLRMPMELVVLPPKPRAEEAATAEAPVRYASRNWRAAAWERERERERELRAGERHPGLAARRRLS